MVVTESETQLTIGSCTDVGKQRDHNEDALWVEQPADESIRLSKGTLLVVADGMGGHAAGERASNIAITTLVREYYSSAAAGVNQALAQAIEKANQAIFDEAIADPAKRGMGTTCVAIVVRGDICYVLNIGDSRLYRLRDNQLRQLTQDHSWVAEQVRAGILTPEEAALHPYKNIVTRSLGPTPQTMADLAEYELQEGDLLLLCSDGLDGPVPDQLIQQVLEAQPSPQAAADELVRLANENGGPDNITVIVVRVDRIAKVAEPAAAEDLVDAGSTTAPLAPTVLPGSATVKLDMDQYAPTEPLPVPTPRGWSKVLAAAITLLVLAALGLLLFFITHPASLFGPVPVASPPIVTPAIATPANATPGNAVSTPTLTATQPSTATPSPTAPQSPTATPAVGR